MTKEFSQSLYEQDDSAVLNVIAWLLDAGWKASVNPDKYGIDVLAVDPTGRPWDIEVEVKHSWRGSRFPFKDVHISARKKKFISSRSIFMMVNDDRSYALAFRGELLRPGVVKSTRFTDGEEFLSVPLSVCRIVSLG